MSAAADLDDLPPAMADWILAQATIPEAVLRWLAERSRPEVLAALLVRWHAAEIGPAAWDAWRTFCEHAEPSDVDDYRRPLDERYER